MLSRVAAVKAPRTHNRRRVTGSSGRRREGRESEPQRPNMSRRVFTSAVLLLLVLMMCCGSGVVAEAVEPSSGQQSLPKSHFVWRDTTGDEKLGSLRVPSLVEVNGDVFAVAEAQCTKGENSFTGIASKFLTLTDEPSKELDKSNLKTQVLVECSANKEGKCPAGNKEKCACRVADQVSGSPNERKVDVSRPTAVVKGSAIYMLVGKNSRTAVNGAGNSGADELGVLLVKGQVSSGTGNNQIHWKETDGVPCTLGDQHNFLERLIGGGGSGVKLNDGTLLFPVEGIKKEREGTGMDGKAVSLILYSSDTKSCTLSKEVPDDGCSDPSVVEWEKEGKLMMMTVCDDGRRRVYESGNKGDSWTEALGTLSRVWGNRKGKERGVRSGFITATIEKRDVMLVTLPVYAKEKEKGELHLWLTDNTHIVDIGPVSEEDDVAASSLLYKSAGSGNNNEENKEELIALYEKKKGGGESSNSLWSVRLTAQLERVKDVLTTWKEVDERVSQLCLTSTAAKNPSTGTACSGGTSTAGLVGFLSGDFSGNTWKDEYLGVNATVTKEEGVEKKDNGVTFKGRGAWAEWPVGSQGENQLYHFANYNFTLVATVSVHGVPKGDTVPLMGATMNDGDKKTVLLGLSYDSGKKRAVLCSGKTTTEYSSNWEPGTTYQVAIVLQNGKQGSAYVDGQRVGNEECALGEAESKEISHFYIGGDVGSTEGQEDLSVTVSNVLLYNRPLSSEEIAGLAKNTITIPKPEGPKTSVVVTQSPAVSAADVQGTVTQSNSAGQRPLEEEPLTANIGAGVVSSAPSTATTPSSDVAQMVATGGGDTMRENGSPQTPEVSVSSGEDGETVEGTGGQEEEQIHPQDRDVNATALSSSLGNLSQGNNSDAGTVRERRVLPLLLLLLGLWGFASQ
ncbi:hypothetical protein ECC02_012021 [Trypanosoma cruzi]|uniref:Uncharacterized protein n=1 Tax=Trypanosoma cruzi TaxID=5693 RepID=A0A7J6XLD8_TRYCR|nr:hypothetical protein ECC02_012021 [Trypanosoma cruzi]